mgnify:CR=1 FL=1
MKDKWERYSAEEHQRMMEMWQMGYSVSRISRALGRTEQSIHYHANRNRDDFPARYLRATEEERAEMVALRAKGWTYEKIARYIGVSDGTVRRYANDGKIAKKGR